VYNVQISYKDYFDGKDAVESMYFHINAFELAEIMLEFEDEEGGLPGYVRKYSEGIDKMSKELFSVLKMLFVRGYGRREERDGRSRFIKRASWLEELIPSPEFEAFYVKLGSNEKFATAFWNGLVSPELLKQAEAINANEDVSAPKTKFRDLPLEEQVQLLRKKIPANELPEVAE
jgi:hypothetical protein